MLTGLPLFATSMWWSSWTRRGEIESRSCKSRCRNPSTQLIKQYTSPRSSTSGSVLGRIDLSTGSVFSLLALLLHLPKSARDGLTSFVFPMAVLLSQKKLIMLEPW